MLKSHPRAISFEEDSCIWRYMNIEKYFSMISEKSLFFCRSDKFGDSLEGEHLKKEQEFQKEQIGNIEPLLYTKECMKKEILVNCWHINKSESSYMWENFVLPKSGIAIKTNGKILRSVLSENNSEFILSKIRYINHQKGIWNSHDYRAEYLNMFIPFVHVRKEFENENELRIIHRLDENGWITEEYWQKQPHQVGKFINVNLTNLIEKIVFSPNLSQLEIESIKEKSQNLGYDFQFEKSKFLN